MTQTATAPDGVGLVILTPTADGEAAQATLYEDGQVIRPPGADWSKWESAADARAAAWDRYVARWRANAQWSHVFPAPTPGYSMIPWTTHS